MIDLSVPKSGGMATVRSGLFEILGVLPSLAVAHAIMTYALDYLQRIGRVPLVQSTDAAQENRLGSRRPGSAYLVVGKRQLVIVLQLLVSSLVTFGGTAFALLSVNSFGTFLGLGHLSVGIFGLFVGLLAVRRKFLPQRSLLAANAAIIAYSTFSESLAEIESLLPSSALHDSLIGTLAAIAMSGILIYLLSRY